MGELVVERVRKAEMIAWFLVCGGAVGADLWRGGGQGFERVRLWRGGACQGLRERQEARLAGVGISGLADGTFSRA